MAHPSLEQMTALAKASHERHLRILEATAARRGTKPPPPRAADPHSTLPPDRP